MRTPTPYVIRLQTPVPVSVKGQVPVIVRGQVPVTVHGQVPVISASPLPVSIRNPDYVADVTAVFVAILALLTLIISLRQLGLAKTQTTDAEKSAKDSNDAKALMEQSVGLMKAQVDYLNRKANLRVTLTDGTTRLIPTYADAYEGPDDDEPWEGWGSVRLSFRIHNDGDKSARHFILRLLTPTGTRIHPRLHSNLTLEGIATVNGVNYQRHACDVPFVPNGSSALAPSLDFVAPLSNAGVILWQAAHDDGTDPSDADYGEIDYAMPDVTMDDDTLD